MDRLTELYKEDEKVLLALKCISKHGGITVGTLQREINIGYARAAKLLDFFVEIGVFKKRRYILRLGDDGKRHRSYLPLELAMSENELEELIHALESYEQLKEEVSRLREGIRVDDLYQRHDEKLDEYRKFFSIDPSKSTFIKALEAEIYRLMKRFTADEKPKEKLNADMTAIEKYKKKNIKMGKDE